MNRCAGLILRVIAATTLVACLALGAHLAWHARAESGEQGAGAAQGDLGFYFVLVVATPVAAALVAVAMALDSYARRRSSPSTAQSPFINALCLGCALLFAWNWFYLLVIWRA